MSSEGPLINNVGWAKPPTFGGILQILQILQMPQTSLKKTNSFEKMKSPGSVFNDVGGAKPPTFGGILQILQMPQTSLKT